MKHDVMETWTAEEDRLLLHLVDVHGTSWKAIGKSFPSRTVSSIRNRYQRIVNGMKQGGKSRCQRCGMIKRGHSCQGRVCATDGDEVLHGPVTEKPSSLPWVNTEFRLGVDEDVTEVEEHEEVSFHCHLFSYHTMQTANDMGFEDVTHPPPLVQGFPFVTSLP
jgi:hypothetical protein